VGFHRQWWVRLGVHKTNRWVHLSFILHLGHLSLENNTQNSTHSAVVRCTEDDPFLFVGSMYGVAFASEWSLHSPVKWYHFSDKNGHRGEGIRRKIDNKV
jgi:hypothetical protein